MAFLGLTKVEIVMNTNNLPPLFAPTVTGSLPSATAVDKTPWFSPSLLEQHTTISAMPLFDAGSTAGEISHSVLSHIVEEM